MYRYSCMCVHRAITVHVSRFVISYLQATLGHLRDAQDAPCEERQAIFARLETGQCQRSLWATVSSAQRPADSGKHTRRLLLLAEPNCDSCRSGANLAAAIPVGRSQLSRLRWFRCSQKPCWSFSDRVAAERIQPMLSSLTGGGAA